MEPDGIPTTEDTSLGRRGKVIAFVVLAIATGVILIIVWPHVRRLFCGRPFCSTSVKASQSAVSAEREKGIKDSRDEEKAIMDGPLSPSMSKWLMVSLHDFRTQEERYPLSDFCPSPTTTLSLTAARFGLRSPLPPPAPATPAPLALPLPPPAYVSPQDTTSSLRVPQSLDVMAAVRGVRSHALPTLRSLPSARSVLASTIHRVSGMWGGQAAATAEMSQPLQQHPLPQQDILLPSFGMDLRGRLSRMSWRDERVPSFI